MYFYSFRVLFVVFELFSTYAINVLIVSTLDYNTIFFSFLVMYVHTINFAII